MGPSRQDLQDSSPVMVRRPVAPSYTLVNYVVCGNNEALGFLSKPDDDGHHISRGTDVPPPIQST